MTRALPFVLLLSACYPEPIEGGLLDDFCESQDIEFREGPPCRRHIVDSIYWDGNACVDYWSVSCHCVGEDCDNGYGQIDPCTKDYALCLPDNWWP